MYPHFADAFANRLNVTKIAKFRPANTCCDPRAGISVTKVGKLVFKCLGLADFEHV
jgi:hypothetical protein